MSWKERYIEKYGEAAYAKRLVNVQEWRRKHPEKPNAYSKARHKEFEVYLKMYAKARNRIRAMHRKNWSHYKSIIAPMSQLQHQWLPRTADYTGLALVEANPHRYGIIDVIQILEGAITLYTEEGIRRGEQ